MPPTWSPELVLDEPRRATRAPPFLVELALEEQAELRREHVRAQAHPRRQCGPRGPEEHAQVLIAKVSDTRRGRQRLLEIRRHGGARFRLPQPLLIQSDRRVAAHAVQPAQMRNHPKIVAGGVLHPLRQPGPIEQQPLEQIAVARGRRWVAKPTLPYPQ